MANLAGLLTTTAAAHPDRPAVRLDDTTMSYRELDEAAARCAGLLRAHGVSAGDRVGIMLPNVPEFPVVYFGALRLGAVVVPMNEQESQTFMHLLLLEMLDLVQSPALLSW